MRDRDQSVSAHDGPVEAALADYFARIDRGEEVDLSALATAHPGCEDGLRRFLKGERKVHEAVSAVSAAPPASMAGRRLGDFQLLQVIGRGGMGVVYEAEQMSLGRKVAVKLLPSALCADPRHRTRFQNEARILAQLAHAHIVHVIAVGEEAETYYFAMQYVEGMTADRLIRRWSNEKPAHDAETARGQLPDDTKVESVFDSANGQVLTQFPAWVASYAEPSERYRLCARIAAEVADGLAHAHACGVLHRDVKPSNILLDQSGTARLTDFGLARMYGDATLTATGAILGTLRYASPEQLGGSHTAVDERSDIYSLGVTLWELVTGRRLFKAENHHSVISQVLNTEAPRASSFAAKLPRDLETVIAHAMSKEPRDRYASAQAMADDLRRFLGGRPIQAKPVTLGERAFRWANRNRVLATTAIGSLIVLLMVAMLASGLVLRANSRTAAALARSREQGAIAKQSAAAAEASERQTRELHYAADMTMAGRAWKQNEFAHVRAILDRYAQPTIGANGVPTEDLRGFEWYFLDRQVPRPPELVYQHDKELYLLEYMPDGHEFFTAGQDSIVRWHNGDSGTVVRSLDTQQQEVNGVSYNPTRTCFTTAGDDGTVKVWNAKDLSLIRSIKANDGKCYFAKFIKDELIFTGGEITPCHFFSAATGELVRQLNSPDANVAGVVSPGLTDVYVSRSLTRAWTCYGSQDNRYPGIYVWDMANGRSRRFCEDLGITSIQADKSEKLLFVTSLAGTLRVLDAADCTERCSIKLPTALYALSLSEDEHYLVAGGNNGHVYLWHLDLKDAKVVTSPIPVELSVHKGRIHEAIFTPDGNALITVGQDGTVRRTVLGGLEPFRDVSGLVGNYTTTSGPDTVAAFEMKPIDFKAMKIGETIPHNALLRLPTSGSVSDRTLVVVNRNNYVGIIQLATGRLVQKAMVARVQSSFDFTSDGSRLAILSDVFEKDKGGRISLLDVRTGRLETFSPAAGASPHFVYFCIDNGIITSLPAKAELVCWNLADGSVRWTSPIAGRLAASSRDHTLLITAEDKDIKLIDCRTGRICNRARCEYHVTAIESLADGHSFVVAGGKGQVSIWQLSTLQPLFELANVGTAPWLIKLLPNGFLALAREVVDGRVKNHWYEF